MAKGKRSKKRIPQQSPPTGSGRWHDTHKDAKGAKRGRKRPSDKVSAPVSTSSCRVVWSTRLIDKDATGDWDWNLEADEACALLKYLEDLQGKTWKEVEAEQVGGRERHNKHHSQSVDTLVPAARKRLAAHLTEDELPEALFRFRLSGKTRLWGIRQGAIFLLLWYDRNHMVYQTD